MVQVLHLPGVLLHARIWMSFLVHEWYQASSPLLSHLLGAYIHRASHWAGSLTTGERDPQIKKDLAANPTANPLSHRRLI